jgi:thiamine biosynthesis lipoprotein
MVKQKNVTWLIVFVFVLSFTFPSVAQVLVKRQTIQMGSVFDISLIAQDSVQANVFIDRAEQEIERIENLISEWRPGTQISDVNRNAGIKPVKVDKEVFELTQRAIVYSSLTNGAFDISIAAMDKLWRFDDSMTEMPDSNLVRKSVEKVGYEHIILDSLNSTIFLTRQGMKIGFGSIGKGYAADKCRSLLQANGVSGGIVNASGDLSTWGTQLNKKTWMIGINNPFKTRGLVKIVKMNTGSAATSGSYEKYAEIDGKRYSHIINPKTGYPSSGLTSVTILGAHAEFANFLSTSIMVLGSEVGQKLLKRFPEYKYVLISDTGNVVRSRRLSNQN